jgi:hypothetical protein
MFDRMQDEDLAKADLRDQARLESERMPWESAWREIDERFPHGAGGFNKQAAGQIRGHRNYDSTHITALERFAAAGVAITTPEEMDYIRPRFLDEDLMKQREVQLWCEAAGRRLYAIRHAAHTGFGVAVNEDWDQLGRYGTSAVYQEADPERGMFYRTLHLSECWIDVDYAGRVDRVHRKFERSARQLASEFGEENLTPKMRDALKPGGNPDAKFEILHIVAPNTKWDAERMDYNRFPIASRYLACDEKLYIRRKGYFTMPISVSRHMTSAGEIYGRSPAFKVMPNIQGVNQMKLDTLRAAAKGIDPALLLYDDYGATTIQTKKGGINFGFVNERGQSLVSRMPGGENGIPYALEMIQDEQATIRTAFLEEFYATLTDPNSRMTTTEVLERINKQGVLVRPFASRYATEKQNPMTQRDLDLALRFGQIDPFPEVVQEAGAWPVIDYENPLAQMARAEMVQRDLRGIEAITPLINLDQDALDVVNADELARVTLADIGVRPSVIRTAEEIAERRAARAEAQQAAIEAEMLAKSAGAVKDLAQANAISEGM